MFSIYYAICKPTGKAYVGKTNKAYVFRRWQEHVADAFRGEDRYLCRAIRKHGPEAFEVRKIDGASTKERAIEFEKFYIRLFDTNKKDRGYNLTIGGEGIVGYIAPPEVLEKRASKNRGDKHWTKRTPPSSERIADTRRKQRETFQKKWLTDPQYREKRRQIGVAKRGIELRKDLSTDKMVDLHAQGFDSRHIGKLLGTNKTTVIKRLRTRGIKFVRKAFLTPEHRAKLSAAKKGSTPWNKKNRAILA